MRGSTRSALLWASVAMQWRSTVGLFSAITTVVMPVVFLVLASRASRAADATPLVAAVALMSLWSSTVWGAGAVLRRELRDGTFGAAITGVHPPHLVLVGKSLGGTVHAVALIAPTTAVTVVVLGLPVHIGQPGWLAVGLLVVIASGTALGVLLACVFLLTRYGPQLSSALMYPVYLVGGLLIPPSALPDVVRPVAAGVSLRWANEFLVGAAAGRVPLGPLGVAVGLTVIYAIAGWMAFARIVTHARRDGRFDL